MTDAVRTRVVGWDIGGANLKASVVHDGVLVAAAQWPCPLWEGLDRLGDALDTADALWRVPGGPPTHHAVTMTGEMVDLFEHREDGVRRLTALLGETLSPGAPDSVRFYTPERWCDAQAAARHWRRVASANWQATASWLASVRSSGVLVDIGTTTTDLIAYTQGHVSSRSASDLDRLTRGELVYQGVVRTPLCALGPRIGWRGQQVNLMNELFATTADAYRLTGELDPAHDLHPSADGGPKDPAASRRRLARMIGLDARDAEPLEWLAFAHAWRQRQVVELGAQLRRVLEASPFRLAPDEPPAVAVAAGCGAFLVPDVLEEAGATMPVCRFGHQAAPQGSERLQVAAEVCAPAVAVAMLLARALR